MSIGWTFMLSFKRQNRYLRGWCFSVRVVHEHAQWWRDLNLPAVLDWYDSTSYLGNEEDPDRLAVRGRIALLTKQPDCAHCCCISGKSILGKSSSRLEVTDEGWKLITINSSDLSVTSFKIWWTWWQNTIYQGFTEDIEVIGVVWAQGYLKAGDATCEEV